MFLDAVSREVETPIEFTNGNGNGHQKSIFSPWKTWEPSQISHHGSMCCELAREWLFNTDMSSLNGGSLFTGRVGCGSASNGGRVYIRSTGAPY
jgi:hypothetical protein